MTGVVTGDALVEAASTAPTGAGVYVFLDDQRRLLYVGKAVNLRRRLQQHAKELPGAAGRSKYARVGFVAWEELADDDAACAREADLIVALQPAQNAAIAGTARWTYLVVAHGDDGDTRFSLASGDPPPAGRVYGCFPHLGKGQSSKPGIACSDGFTAFLRLLWATGPAGAAGAPYPRSISGTAPPFDVTVPVDPARGPALHRFLSGTSAKLLGELGAAIEGVEPYLRPALARDLALARAFSDHGPAALRRFRLRHRLPAGPVSRATFTSLLHAELVSAVGPVVLPAGGSERTRRHRLP